jgi:hypothetical protein
MEVQHGPLQKWLQDCIDEMNQVSRDRTIETAIEQRARAYSFGTAGWLQTAGSSPERDDADPRTVLAHCCALIPVKIYRALMGLAPTERDGTAKVALLAIDRSRAAWIEVVERGLATVGAVEPFVAELGCLAGEFERVFPNARGSITE